MTENSAAAKITDVAETAATPKKKKKHRLRNLFLLSAAAGGVAAYRQKRLEANDTMPPPR